MKHDLRTFRPSPMQVWHTIPLPLLIGGLIFGSLQLFLANLSPPALVSVAVVEAVGVGGLVISSLAFFRNARIIVTPTGEVAVIDWLGRQRLKAPLAELDLELLSVRTLGFARSGAILSVRGGTAAVAIWRDTWGDDVIRRLRRFFAGKDGADDSVAVHQVSHRALQQKYPHVHPENIGAIAAIVAFVLVLAVVLSHR
jgi:hypothetical protein